jgi:hypothetical protein
MQRLTRAIALSLFATGIALSILLIAAYSRPFTGEISVKPDLSETSNDERVRALKFSIRNVCFGSKADIVTGAPRSLYPQKRTIVSAYC